MIDIHHHSCHKRKNVFFSKHTSDRLYIVETLDIPTDHQQFIDDTITRVYNTLEQLRSHNGKTRLSQPVDDSELLTADIAIEPTTLAQALNGSNSKEWQAALDKEISNLWARGTFSSVKFLPPGAKVIKSKLTFKIALNPDNTVKKFKIRVVARGDLQGWDTFHDTYAGTAKRRSIMLILNIAAALNWHVHTCDVTSAFLYPDLQEQLYLQMPTQVTGKTREYVKLNKAIYGLRQAANAFIKHMRATLVSIGFTQLKNDDCVYVKHSGNDTVYICSHVDDLLMTSNSLDLLRTTAQNIQHTYEITVEEQPTAYLGMCIDYDRTAGTLLLSMPGYTQRMVDEFLPNRPARPPKTPSLTHSDETSTDSTALDSNGKKNYMRVVGSLLYLAISTRPDILHAVHTLTQHMQSPATQHLHDAHRVLHYLSGTTSHGITFVRDDDITLHAFADAAYANTHDRKSQYGLTFRLGTKSAHFYSVSKKQSIVAISSTEAEYVALAECVRDVIWLRSFLHELGYTQLHPTPIYQDNKSCIAIAENTGNTERTKHIDIRHHFLKDFIASNDIKLYYLPTDDMVADILTKSLVTAQFSKLANVLLKLEVLTSE